MAKSLTFAVFLLGVLIAQIACARPTRGKPRSKPSKASAEVAPKPTTEPKSDSVTTTDQPIDDNNTPWILPGFDKKETEKLNENGKKCWKNEKYHVCLTRNGDETKLYWKNEKFNFEVEMDLSDEGENVDQNWKYEDGNVQLSLSTDGSWVQDWKFGPKDRLLLYRYSDGTTNPRWFGSAQPEKVENFKKLINSWCENNDFFVGKDNCVIYNKIKVDNEPAWELVGFDKTQVNQLNKNGRRCWVNRKYDVCLKKSQNETRLNWNKEKSNAKVIIEISSWGSIYQNWTYQDNNVQISQQKDGSSDQEWKFGSSKLYVSEDSDGTVNRKWRGNENPEALKSFQQFMEVWCENNDFFVGKENCLIYKV